MIFRRAARLAALKTGGNVNMRSTTACSVPIGGVAMANLTFYLSLYPNTAEATFLTPSSNAASFIRSPFRKNGLHTMGIKS